VRSTTVMCIENFIRDAFYKPADVIAYHVGRELAELHPGKTILEGQTWYFDLEAFVCSKKCSIVEESSVFNHIRTDWEAGKEFKEFIQNAWLNVLWEGQLIDLVLITFGNARRHWIIADTRKIAESFLDTVCESACEVQGEILVYKDGFFEKNKELLDSIKNATFDNLILPEVQKAELQNDFRQFFEAREIYDRYRIPWKRGAILIGPPGNGKTHTVKALINQLGKPCIYVRSFKAEYGNEQENIAEVFARARMTAPCLVVLEDLDSMIDERNRAFLLNELDGFETNTGVVVIATTNHPEKLDAAILERPSRFDRKYHFNLPGEAERFAYIAAWNKELEAELRLSANAAEEIVRATNDFSFAYMKELFLSSMVQWMANGRTVSMDEVINQQAALLRGQIKSAQVPVVDNPAVRFNFFKRGA